MDHKPQVELEVLKWLVEYTKARCEVYYKKEVLKLPPPWTDHPQLSYFKFTNVKRYLDRQSKWIINNVVNNTNLSWQNRSLNIAVFQIINHGDVMKHYFGGDGIIDFDKVDPNNPDNFFEDLLDYELSQDQSFIKQSNAYFLSYIGRSVSLDIDKKYQYTLSGRAYLVWKYREHVFNAFKAQTGEEAYNELRQVKTFGEFIAYQVFATMSYCSDTVYTDNDYCACGPGTRAGLNYLFPYEPDENCYDLIYYLRDNIKTICEENGLQWNIEEWLSFLPEEHRAFTLQDWTNSMCELNKLCKIRYEEPMRVRYYHWNGDEE